MNDLLNFVNNQELTEKLKQKLRGKFVLKNLQKPKKVLGLELNRTISGQASVKHMRSIENIFHQNKIMDARAVLCQMTSDIDLNVTAKARLSVSDSHRYRSNIGLLLHLVRKACPVLLHSASLLESHVSTLTPIQAFGLKWVLPYLKDSKHVQKDVRMDYCEQLNTGVNSNWGTVVALAIAAERTSSHDLTPRQFL